LFNLLFPLMARQLATKYSGSIMATGEANDPLVS
jgi:hypothetical protein